MKLGRFPGLAIACLILAALSGFLYWSTRHPKSDEAATPATTPVTPTILNVDPGNVTGVTLKVKGEPDVILAKQAGTWQITAPQPLPADQEQVSMLLSALAPLTAQEVVTSNAPGSNLSQFGLAVPSMELDIEQKGKPAQSLLFGDDTPVGGNTYAMLAGDARIFTASNDSKRELNKTLTDLRNKQLFDFGDNDPDSIDIEANGSQSLPKLSLVAAHNAQGWWQNGKNLDADSTEAVVSGLRSLTATKFAITGFTTPILTVTVISNGGKLVEKAEIAKSGDQYLARRAGDPSLYVLDAGSVDGVLSSAKAVHPAK